MIISSTILYAFFYCRLWFVILPTVSLSLFMIPKGLDIAIIDYINYFLRL